MPFPFYLSVMKPDPLPTYSKFRNFKSSDSYFRIPFLIGRYSTSLEPFNELQTKLLPQRWLPNVCLTLRLFSLLAFTLGHCCIVSGNYDQKVRFMSRYTCERGYCIFFFLSVSYSGMSSRHCLTERDWRLNGQCKVLHI
ncbi:hypothetical protein BDV27DRAFT_103114 [Aspergillus caelatus]|uniref:Uncharacterized protein n=1 Tax=Aspergillus caelatus TaxID=61420 RepID=A0A5N7A8C9_9EURO|nr:uncharacterized protein BDV27DRAFT_103114 [Aspergillus caelatus]KAE8365466.1 hypothetical protein BDV27DRAFT_103114 [Aspergillus caelatus]